MISVLTNPTSLNAQQNLSRSSGNLSNNLSRLSSGLRVRSAADDAAGLAISESFKAKIRSLDQARRNANDGISLAQTADGALQEMGSMLSRMRELATQSATETLSEDQRGYLHQEFDSLRQEIDRIAKTTEFNGVKLLDGSKPAGIKFQVGAGNTTDDTLALTIKTATIGASGLNLTAANVALSTASKARAVLTTLDKAINGISSRRAGLGAMQNRLQITISNLQSYSTNLSASNSRIVDVDVAAETAQMTKNNILVQAGASMLAQANQAPQVALSLLR